MLHPLDRFVAQIVLVDRSRCPIWARLLLVGEDEGGRTIWNINIDEVLRVEGVNKALTGSHVGWGKDREVHVL